MMPSISEYSAGGVVYRQSAISNQQSAITWLICKHAGYHKWILPKGIVEAGEAAEEAAVREVSEETGITAKIIKRLEPDEKYFYRKGGQLVHKRATFYLMEYVAGEPTPQSFETEDVRWVSAAEALKLLAFEGQQNLLKSVMSLL